MKLEMHPLLVVAIVYLFTKDSAVWETLKKNAVSTLEVIRNDREARIDQRHNLSMTAFANKFYSTTGKAINDYERLATPPRTFAR